MSTPKYPINPENESASEKGRDYDEAKERTDSGARQPRISFVEYGIDTKYAEGMATILRSDFIPKNKRWHKPKA